MEDNKNSKYDLYTEHIVPEPGKKIKRYVKKSAFVLVMAVFFGLIAGLVMIIVYKTGRPFLESETTKENITLSQGESSSEQQTTSHEAVTINPAESEQETTAPIETDDWNNGEIAGMSDINNMSDSLKKVVKRINQSTVTISAAKDSIDSFYSTFQNIDEAFGVIVASDSDFYYIVTDFTAVNGAETITVTYNDGTIAEGSLVSGDSTTGIAVIKATFFKASNVRIADLADSSSVSVGDVAIATGKLYGFVESMGYGFVTGTNNILSDTDSSYQLLNTSIQCKEDAYGITVNLSGQVTGIITNNYSAGSDYMVNAYAISEIRTLVENLVNGKKNVYLGIKGQEVNDSIKETYGIPYGIYISAVEVNSPAYTAGIQTGDIITKIAGDDTLTMKDYMKVLNSNNSSDTVEITVKRKGRESYKEIVFSVVLGVE